MALHGAPYGSTPGSGDPLWGMGALSPTPPPHPGVTDREHPRARGRTVRGESRSAHPGLNSSRAPGDRSIVSSVTTRIALAQIDTTVGDFAGNAAKVRDVTVRARAPAGLAWWSSRSWPCAATRPATSSTRPTSSRRRAALWPSSPRRPSGRRASRWRSGSRSRSPTRPAPGLYNAVALIEGGRLAAVGRKSLLPTYDVFDETRYFLAVAPQPPPRRRRRSGCASASPSARTSGTTSASGIEPRYARDPIAELRQAAAPAWW